jgi:deazaflavin-dependent oxidoreductase (nitroreductase family)
MTEYSTFHSIVQKMASSGPGSWFFSKTLHHLDHGLINLTNGRKSMTSLLSGAPLVMVTTTGARSGLLRTLPLLCIRDPNATDSFALIASNWGQKNHPAWYFNLRANPRATCSIAGRAADYVAHEAKGEEYDSYWQCAMDTYLGFPTYRERAGDRHIPILVMTPV